MRIAVIGCGYLGTVHAAVLAEFGHDVVGVDVDVKVIQKLQRGEAPYFEPGLQAALRSGARSGQLQFSTDIAAADGADVFFLAVGTPQVSDGIAADLSFIDAACESVLPLLRSGSLVVGKSTVPVGTAALLAARIRAHAPEAMLLWNPEFLREGTAMQDTRMPDRLVYGTPGRSDSAVWVARLDAVYETILARGVPRLVTDYATSELIKTAANSFLAMKISFINAIGEVAERAGADVTVLADALGLDERIGRQFLNAGLGFGGGCLPKDVRAFTARAEELGASDSVALLREVDRINLRQRSRVVEMASEIFDGQLSGRRIALLGVTFKPESDDIRDSPALDVAVALHEAGADVVVTDPCGINNARRRYPQLRYSHSSDDAIAGSDLVILATGWAEYRSIDPIHAASLVREPRILDARNVLDRSRWIAAGWEHRAPGRGDTLPGESQVSST